MWASLWATDFSDFCAAWTGDSFIPYYSGEFACPEVKPAAHIADSGTLERRNASLEVHGSADWRTGVVYAAYNRYPQVSPTCRCGCDTRNRRRRPRNLAGEEAWQKGYRLIGGLVSPTDSSPEAAARREVPEEAHIEVSALEYLGSFLLDDWRYRNEIDKVMTTVFLGPGMFGAIEPDDNNEELKWFRLNRKFDIGCLGASHKPLLSGVLDAIERSSTKELKEGTIP